MRFSVFVAAALIAMPGSAFAFDSPRALVEAIYEPYLRHQTHADLTRFYSDRLVGMLDQQLVETGVSPAAFNSEQHANDIAGFNPFVEGDSFFPFDFAIAEPVILGDTAVATVSYRNFGQPSLLSLSLVKQKEGWKVDDIASLGGGENWLYSWLLTVDPYAN